MTDLPFSLTAPLDERLRAAADAEGKLVRALDALGPLAGRDVVLVDVPSGPLLDRLAALGVNLQLAALSDPFRLDVPDSSLDAVVSLWSAFRGVDRAALAEVDRALRPGGRLLVVHDYGRDDVSTLRGTATPEYDSWSRRDGPFLRDGDFKIRVVHCHWTFASVGRRGSSWPRPSGSAACRSGDAPQAGTALVERRRVPPLEGWRGHSLAAAG